MAGAAVAFTVHVVVAVTIGVALFHLLPHQVLDAVVAGMFLVGAALALREAVKERKDEELVEREVASHRRIAGTRVRRDLSRRVGRPDADPHRQPRRSLPRSSVGGRGCRARPLDGGRSLAVVSGQSLLRLINISTIRIVTAVVLVGLAGFAAWEAAQ